MAEIPGAPPFDPEGLCALKPEHIEVLTTLSDSVYFRALFPENYHVEETKRVEDRRRICVEFNALSASSDSIFRSFKSGVLSDASIFEHSFIIRELYQKHVPLLVMAGDDLNNLLGEALLQDKKYSYEGVYHRDFYDFFNALCTAYSGRAFTEFAEDYDKKMALDAVVRRSFMVGMDVFGLISKDREALLGRKFLDDAVFRDWFQDIDFD